MNKDYIQIFVHDNRKGQRFLTGLVSNDVVYKELSLF